MKKLANPNLPPETICETIVWGVMCGHRNDENFHYHNFTSSVPPIDPWARIRELEAEVAERDKRINGLYDSIGERSVAFSKQLVEKVGIIEHLQFKVSRYVLTRGRADTRIAELVAALEAVEWVSEREYFTTDDECHCPFCEYHKSDGHQSDCQLGRALGREECAE